MSFKQVFIYFYGNPERLWSVLLQDYFGECNLSAWNYIVYFAHSYVQRSFISCDIITRNDNALIQQLMQDIKGVSYGNKLIRKLGFWISSRGFCFFLCLLSHIFFNFLFLSLFFTNFLSVYFKLWFSRIFLFIALYFSYVDRCLLISI